MRSHLMLRLAVALAVAVLFAMAGKPSATSRPSAPVAAVGEPPRQ